MIELNIGNLWDHDFLTHIHALNSQYPEIQVTSMYGSTAKLTPTARSFDRIPSRSFNFIERYVGLMGKIRARWTLNNSCIGNLEEFSETWPLLKQICEDLHSVGVHEWTITSSLIFEHVRELFPEDFIEISTIAEISSPQALSNWQGANGVCLSTSINRDFKMLQRFFDRGVQCSLLANEACLFRCQYRAECYNLSSHNSPHSPEFFNSYPWSRCSKIRADHPVQWLIARMILPQWMKRYYSLTGIQNFKLSFRTAPPEVAFPILKAYMNQHHDGNLLDLWPQIHNLASTKNPSGQLHISCKALDELGFLDKFIRNNAGHVCGLFTCEECGRCSRTLEQATIKHNIGNLRQERAEE